MYSCSDCTKSFKQSGNMKGHTTQTQSSNFDLIMKIQIISTLQKRCIVSGLANDKFLIKTLMFFFNETLNVSH